MTAARKTAAQKAAEAAEREEYTGTAETPQLDHSASEAAVARVEEAAGAEPGKLAKGKKGETVQQLKNRLRNEAEREVLNTHKDEVITITQAKYDEHGLEYVRRLTDEEKAAKIIEDLYRKHPNLRPETTVLPDPVGNYPYGAYQGRDAGRVEADQASDHGAEASVGE